MKLHDNSSMSNVVFRCLFFLFTFNEMSALTNNDVARKRSDKQARVYVERDIPTHVFIFVSKISKCKKNIVA